MAHSKRHPRRLVARVKNWLRPARQYPWTVANEISAVTRVLKGSQWNMSYGRGLVHENLEREFARFVGGVDAVAVSSGGMALQIAMRALGVEPGDEVIHQVDTCVANPFAVFAAGAIPIFADSDPRTFGVSARSLESWLTTRTKMVIAIHLWGNAEELSPIDNLARTRGLTVIEDCCLALGTTIGSQHVGQLGRASVFSFGCVKPIQAGEGGMIVTSDTALAREMRTIRSWGERTREFNDSDIHTLAWNGRMSEIVAAVALEQLRGYPRLLGEVTSNCLAFIDYLKRFGWVEPIHSKGSSFSQLVLRLRSATVTKGELVHCLRLQGVGSEPVNFEPATRYSFFKAGGWVPWVRHEFHDRVRSNYSATFPNADSIYDNLGVGLARNNFLGRGALPRLIHRWEKAVAPLERQKTLRRAS